MLYIFRQATKSNSVCVKEIECKSELTRSIDKPKLPLVVNSRILEQSAKISHTLIRPSIEVLAKYWLSADRAIAHISPALLPSEIISVSVNIQSYSP